MWVFNGDRGPDVDDETEEEGENEGKADDGCGH